MAARWLLDRAQSTSFKLQQIKELDETIFIPCCSFIVQAGPGLVALHKPCCSRRSSSLHAPLCTLQGLIAETVGWIAFCDGDAKTVLNGSSQLRKPCKPVNHGVRMVAQCWSVLDTQMLRLSALQGHSVSTLMKCISYGICQLTENYCELIVCYNSVLIT